MNKPAKSFEQGIRDILGKRKWESLPPHERRTVREISRIQRETSKEIKKYDKTGQAASSQR